MEKNKIKVGILTMSDGRPYLHAEYEALNFQYQQRLRLYWRLPATLR